MEPINQQELSETTDRLFKELEDRLEDIRSTEEDIVHQAENAAGAILRSLKQLKEFITAYRFRDKAEEIQFFKYTKPKFYSLLIYYVKVFNIETERPIGSDKEQKKYLEKELKRLKHFFDNNRHFYRYYRSGANYLDKKYFLRGQVDLRLSVDAFYYDADPNFSTPQDYKVAKILANEQLRVYLNRSLEELYHTEGDDNGLMPANGGLKWTGSKTALIELLYALQSTGVFNHGAADIRQIASHFERMFLVELGNYYRTFQEIRIRKSGRTNFLDQLAERLVKRMDEADENPKFAT